MTATSSFFSDDEGPAAVEHLAAVLLDERDQRLRGLYPWVYEVVIEKLLSTRTASGDLPHRGDAVRAIGILRHLLGSICSKKGGGDNVPHRWTKRQGLIDYRFAYEPARDYRFNVSELRSAVATYIEHPWMHEPYLDWLCADALIYVTYEETAANHTMAEDGTNAWITLNNQYGVWSLMAWVVAKWAAWAYFVYWLYGKYGFYGAAPLVAITMFLQAHRIWRRRKTLKKMTSMRRVYYCLDTQTIAWSVVEREMEDARRLGAMWPGELWRLVDSRKPAALNTNRSN